MHHSHCLYKCGEEPSLAPYCLFFVFWYRKGIFDLRRESFKDLIELAFLLHFFSRRLVELNILSGFFSYVSLEFQGFFTIWRFFFISSRLYYFCHFTCKIPINSKREVVPSMYSSYLWRECLFSQRSLRNLAFHQLNCIKPAGMKWLYSFHLGNWNVSCSS